MVNILLCYQTSPANFFCLSYLLFMSLARTNKILFWRLGLFYRSYSKTWICPSMRLILILHKFIYTFISLRYSEELCVVASPYDWKARRYISSLCGFQKKRRLFCDIKCNVYGFDENCWWNSALKIMKKK